MTTFGTKMTHFVDVWLNASSSTDKIRQVLFSYNVFSWNDFKDLDKDEMYTLKRKEANGSTVTLRHAFARKLANAREYTSFFNSDGQKPRSNSPTKWSRDNYDDWIDNIGATNPTPSRRQ